MRHATWNAIAAITGTRSALNTANGVRACDWVETPDRDNDAFDATAATKLVGDYPAPVDRALPTCPLCALFVDMALQIRSESEQALAVAAMEAERKAKERAA